MTTNHNIRQAFNEFYSKYAPLCYGLALDKLRDKTGAEEVLRSVFLSMQSALLADVGSNALDKEVCRRVHQELRMYKRRRVLKDLFACSAVPEPSVSRIK
jgi:hypothetical protein